MYECSNLAHQCSIIQSTSTMHAHEPTDHNFTPTYGVCSEYLCFLCKNNQVLLTPLTVRENEGINKIELAARRRQRHRNLRKKSRGSVRKRRVRDRAKRAAETEDQRAARLARLSANHTLRLAPNHVLHVTSYLIAIVERRYREISRVHCRVLLRVCSTSNNARGNERVMFPRYRCSTMVIRYLSYIKKYWSFKSSSNTKGP